MKQQILLEVNTSKWQPKFEFTDNLDTVVDSILKPHEDYFLKLHDKVKEIIQREILFLSGNLLNKDQHKNQITFADVCNWQKELFEYKIKEIENINLYAAGSQLNEHENYLKDIELAKKANGLPNQHINLGLRINNTISIKNSNWILPDFIFLEELKEMCFPISFANQFLQVGNEKWHISNEISVKVYCEIWYKTFQTIHFFEDLNGRLGGIIINILSYLLTDKYLIKIEN